MYFSGVLPEDAPDPRLDRDAFVRDFPIDVYGLVSQSHVEDIGERSTESSSHRRAVSVTYQFWRNPDDRSDPSNLAELDDAARAALDEVPPWPRPAWLVERVEQMRYPMLWESVRTTWRADGSDTTNQDDALVDELVGHARYILVNQFRAERGWIGTFGPGDFDAPDLPQRSAVRHGVTVTVDGHATPGVEIDTDPFVWAVGAGTPDGGLLTAVLPRGDLKLLTVEFARLTR